MGGGAPRLAMASQNPAPRPAPAPAAPALAGPRLAGLADVVALAVAHRDLKLKFAIETQARLVAFEEGRIEIALAPGGSVTLVQELQNRLTEWTGRRWLVALSSQRAGRPAGRGGARPLPRRLDRRHPCARAGRRPSGADAGGI